MEIKHTPTPYSIDPNYPGDILGADGKDVLTTCLQGNGLDLNRPHDERLETVAFVVRACNAHAELVEALTKLRREYKALARTGVDRIRDLGGNVDNAEDMYEPVLGEITGTDAALAKAEGQQ